MIKINKRYDFEKVGLNEVEGLKAVLKNLVRPLQKSLGHPIYWDEAVSFAENEYNSRDGFRAHSHNCGGYELKILLPSCERYSFPFVAFEECEDSECNCKLEDGDGSCPEEADGGLDSILRIWLKFEGINENGVMSFYFYMGGGNADVPYFRSGREATIFGESFQATDLKQVRKTGGRIVRKMLKVMGAK